MDSRQVGEMWAQLVRGGFFAEFTYEAERRYRKSLQHLAAQKDAWILEVGCGTGRFHQVLRRIGFPNIVSCDITLEHIARARHLNPEGLFVVARAEALPFRGSCFQALVSNAAVEHFSAPREGVLEFGRVTASDAQLVITSDCFVWRILQVLGLYRSKMPIDRAMSYSEFQGMFRAASLDILTFDAWGVTHYLRRLERIAPAYSRPLLQITQRDDSWANQESRSHWVNRLRMVFLDENLFLVRNTKAPESHVVGEGAAIQMSSVLACPACKHPVVSSPHLNGMVCDECRVLYPVREGIPVMLVEEARSL